MSVPKVHAVLLLIPQPEQEDLDVLAHNYLSEEVDSVLERNRRQTSGGSANRPFSRKKNFTSPLLFPGTHRPDVECVGLEMLREEHSGASSEGEASSSSLSTSSVVEAEVRGRTDLELSSSPATRTLGNAGRNWSRGDAVVANGGWSSRRYSDMVKRHDHPGSSPSNQTQMLDSLHTINSQLGELLHRVAAPTAPAGMSVPTFLPEEPALPPSNTRYFPQCNHTPSYVYSTANLCSHIPLDTANCIKPFLCLCLSGGQTL